MMIFNKFYQIYGSILIQWEGTTRVIEEGHEMKIIEDMMTILHKQSNHKNINKLEDIKIIKAAASQNILNDIINGRNDPLYKILISVDNYISIRRQPEEEHAF